MKGQIAKIDYQTITQMQPIFQHKNLFADLNNLPDKQAILSRKAIEKGGELTSTEIREILKNTGLYRTDTMIIRDFGTHLITVNLSSFVDKEDDEILAIASGFDFYLLASKLFLVILSKAYLKRRWTDLRLSKKEIIQTLGYEPDAKYIYGRVKQVFDAFYHCDYVIFESSKKNLLSSNARTMGRFIYNLSFETHDIVVSVNERFIGCVANMISGQIEKEDLKTRLNRGYINYPVDHIANSINYDKVEFDLGNYLIAETGNPRLNGKLKDPSYKVIAQKCSTLCELLSINLSRPDKKITRLLTALEKCDLVAEIKPDVASLAQMRSQDALNTVVHIKVKRVKE